MSQRPRDKAPMRDGQNRPQKRPAPGGRRTEVYIPPKRDSFPYIMGGVIGALVVGLMLVIFLLTNRNNSPVINPPVGAGDPTQAVVSGTAPAVEGSEAPRITMDEFKALYDSANKPLIIDVRPKGGFDAGHIRGATSFPEAEVDARIAELPKDRLIVAYCAWPAENESARVATKLLSQYNWNKDNLKVLLGGWNTWNERHGTDPNGYPTDTTAGAPAQVPAGVIITAQPGAPAPAGNTPGLVTVPTTAP